MLHRIVTPLESSFTLHFPTDMVGKKIEIIAFEVKDQISAVPSAVDEKMERLKRIEDLTKDKLVDLSKFKFNRDDANNYEE